MKKKLFLLLSILSLFLLVSSTSLDAKQVRNKDIRWTNHYKKVKSIYKHKIRHTYKKHNILTYKSSKKYTYYGDMYKHIFTKKKEAVKSQAKYSRKSHKHVQLLDKNISKLFELFFTKGPSNKEFLSLLSSLIRSNLFDKLTDATKQAAKLYASDKFSTVLNSKTNSLILNEFGRNWRSFSPLVKTMLLAKANSSSKQIDALVASGALGQIRVNVLQHLRSSLLKPEVVSFNDFVSDVCNLLTNDLPKIRGDVNKVKFILLSIPDLLHKNKLDSFAKIKTGYEGSTFGLEKLFPSFGTSNDNVINNLKTTLPLLISKVENLKNGLEDQDLKRFDSLNHQKISTNDYVNYILFNTFAGDNKNGHNNGVELWINYINDLKHVSKLNDTNQALLDTYNTRFNIMSKATLIFDCYNSLSSSDKSKLSIDVNDFKNALDKSNYDKLDSLNSAFEKQLNSINVRIKSNLNTNQHNFVSRNAAVSTCDEVMQMVVMDLGGF